MSKIKDLTGMKFGQLVVIKRLKCNKWRQSVYLCKCDCGNTIEVVGNDLKNGHTKSCGCTKCSQNRLTAIYPRLYNIWKKIKDRCYNINSNIYKYYGKRGIKVCNEWHDLETFIEWALKNGYQDNLTIDRINNNGNYEPSNCRWISLPAQQNNKRTNRLITYNNETHTIAEWEKIKKFPKDVIRQRINKLKWDIEKAIETPVKKCNNNF